jgi:hypothetical protein
MNSIKIKTLLATTAVAVTGVLGVTGANAQGLAKTSVSITGDNGDYYGYVHSSKSSCESNRKVKVYEMLGSKPKPSQDQKIGSDIAQPNGPDGMWSIGNSGFKHGSFYARATPTSKCAAGISPVIDR